MNSTIENVMHAGLSANKFPNIFKIAFCISNNQIELHILISERD